MATIILVGKTACGKSTTAKLMEKIGYQRIVTDTTRPKREGETDGIDYHFRTKDEFEALKDAGYYAESVDYEAAFGHCSYGSAKEAYESKKDSVIVLNPYGLKMVKNNVIAGSTISIFLDVPEDILVERLHTRGDAEDEIARRLEHDRIDFADMSEVCDYTISVTGKETEEEILNKVLALVNSKSKLHIAFAVDDSNGMMFNHRRVSKDSELCEELLNTVHSSGGRLQIRPYSSPLFEDGVYTSDDPWNKAGPNDIVFIEDVDPATIHEVTEVTLFRWNRKYPSDLKSTFDFCEYELIETKEFAGSSHEKITKEIWKKQEKRGKKDETDAFKNQSANPGCGHVSINDRVQHERQERREHESFYCRRTSK